MKLFVTGVALIALSVALAHFAGINPLYLTLAGIACGLVGIYRDTPPAPAPGAEASPGAATDAAVLARYMFPRPDGGIGPSDTL